MTLLPGAMSSRIFAILLFGIVASAALTWWLSFGERQRAIGQFRDSHLVERIEQVLLAVNALPAADRPGFLRHVSRHGLRLEPWDVPIPASGLLASDFSNILNLRLGNNYSAMALTSKPGACEQSSRSQGWSVNKPLTPPI